MVPKILNSMRFQLAKQHAVKKAQAYQFNRRQTAVLQELYLFRLKIARQYNQPVYRIIPEKALLSLASCLPRDRYGLQECPELSSKLIRKFGDGLLQTIQRGLQTPTAEIEPPSPRTIQDERIQKRYEALKRWRKNQALEMGVKSDVVLPKHLLELLSHHQPASIEELLSLMKEYPYRASRFGSAIFHILSHS
jgi:ribonuclease D